MNTHAIDAREAEMPRRALPVIDLGPYLKGEVGALEQLSHEWRDVCEKLGFLCVINHGIPDELIAEMEAATRAFHALDDEEKLKIKVTDHQRGYIPSRATILKHSSYQTHTKLDTVECMVVATDYPKDHPELIAGKQFYSRNLWPENLPSFQHTVEKYMNTVQALGMKLLPVWAKSLDLPENYFLPYFTEPYSYFRIAKYPKTEFVENQEFLRGVQ